MVAMEKSWGRLLLLGLLIPVLVMSPTVSVVSVNTSNPMKMATGKVPVPEEGVAVGAVGVVMAALPVS